MLIVGVISCAQVFALQSYEIVGASMFPALVGPQVRFVCPATGETILLPAETSPHELRRLVCPLCGVGGVAGSTRLLAGDRLLVDRVTFQLRDPRRFEPVVIGILDESGRYQAVVKRVVGLPGEEVQIIDGDVFVNGRRAAKSLEQLRAMAVRLVDFAHLAHAQAAFAENRETVDEQIRHWPDAACWEEESAAFVIENNQLAYAPPEDPRGFITDRAAHNQLFSRNETDISAVTDLLLTAERVRFQRIGADTDSPPALRFHLANGKSKWSLELSPATHAWRVLHGTAEVAAGSLPGMLAMLDRGDRLAMAIVDGTLQASLGDQLLCRLSAEDASDGIASDDVAADVNAVEIEAISCRVIIQGLMLGRDVYYTGAAGLRPTSGLEQPYQLGMDEYFLLGDNSPISMDSRFWGNPAVQRQQILGRPLLVYWPADRSPAWNGWIQVPRAEKIRYIR